MNREPPRDLAASVRQRRKLEQVRADVEMAAVLGAPMIRLFCGRPLAEAEARRREIRCFQEAADLAAEQGILVGLQNHPSIRRQGCEAV
jgi:sugar phosphate isomerase/epimerase